MQMSFVFGFGICTQRGSTRNYKGQLAECTTNIEDGTIIYSFSGGTGVPTVFNCRIEPLQTKSRLLCYPFCCYSFSNINFVSMVPLTETKDTESHIICNQLKNNSTY